MEQRYSSKKMAKKWLEQYKDKSKYKIVNLEYEIDEQIYMTIELLNNVKIDLMIDREYIFGKLNYQIVYDENETYLFYYATINADNLIKLEIERYFQKEIKRR